MRFYKLFLLIPLFVSFLNTLFTPVIAQEFFDFQDSSKWVITDPKANFTNYYGKKGMYMPAFNGPTMAYLKDFTFTNGTVEVDVLFLGHASYNGFALRMQDEQNYEYLYFRPQSSRQMGAFQYAPVYNKSASWQVYSGEVYSPGGEIASGRWIHIKMVVKDNQAAIYFDENKEPVMAIPELKRGDKSGRIGLISLFGGCIFSNFKITRQDNPEMPEIKSIKAGPEVIREWLVSEKVTNNGTLLKTGENLSLKSGWKNAWTDTDGILDFNKVAGGGDTVLGKTIFVKLMVESDKEQSKKLSLAFTDRAQVYLNNKPVFDGSESHHRDNMSLFYDKNEGIYLSLKKGRNELVIAISDFTRSFGGWGIKAGIEDRQGISIGTK